MRALSVTVAGIATALVACAQPAPDGTALIQSTRAPKATGGVAEVLASRGVTQRPTAASNKQRGQQQPRPDAGPSVKGFRIVNRSKRTAYVDAKWGAVRCETAAGAHCSFGRSFCFNPCTGHSKGEDCCIQCEPPLPSMLVVPGRETRVVPWLGELAQGVSGYCSGDCQCQELLPIPRGTYSAKIKTYAGFVCEFPPCEQQPNGKLTNASPQGPAIEYDVRFSIPLTADEIVVEIGSP